jgi:hypothetical protein
MAKQKQSLPSFRDILVLDRLITGPIVNLMYWAGLGVILLSGFGGIGAVIGVAIGEGPMGWLLTLPTLAFGVLLMVILVGIWRAFCEFYLVVFRISDDLRSLRLVEEDEARRRGPPNP